MPAVITLEEAKAHLGYEIDIVDPALDPLVQTKANAASYLVLAYITTAEEDLSADELERVRTAVLLVLGSLWRQRGDDEDAPPPISETVEHVLYGLRDPTLA